MATPIIMLVLMMAPYLVARLFSAVTRRDFDVRSAAAIGLGMLFIFTGIGHFIETEPMAQMLPPWVPGRTLLVYLTGVLELAVAVGFLMPQSRRFTGWLAAAMLVLFFPVNIYAVIHEIPMGGHAWVQRIFSFERHFRPSSCFGCIGLRSGNLTQSPMRTPRQRRGGEIGLGPRSNIRQEPGDGRACIG